MALGSAGYGHLSRRFYEFCERILEKGGYFLHKYTPRGRLASSWHPWADPSGRMQLPIQEDGVVSAVADHQLGVA
jgi:GH15 family glucan-1,4-alpha-glucosidase